MRDPQWCRPGRHWLGGQNRVLAAVHTRKPAHEIIPGIVRHRPGSALSRVCRHTAHTILDLVPFGSLMRSGEGGETPSPSRLRSCTLVCAVPLGLPGAEGRGAVSGTSEPPDAESAHAKYPRHCLPRSGFGSWMITPGTSPQRTEAASGSCRSASRPGGTWCHVHRRNSTSRAERRAAAQAVS